MSYLKQLIPFLHNIESFSFNNRSFLAKKTFELCFTNFSMKDTQLQEKFIELIVTIQHTTSKFPDLQKLGETLSTRLDIKKEVLTEKKEQGIIFQTFPNTFNKHFKLQDIYTLLQTINRTNFQEKKQRIQDLFNKNPPITEEEDQFSLVEMIQRLEEAGKKNDLPNLLIWAENLRTITNNFSAETVIRGLAQKHFGRYNTLESFPNEPTKYNLTTSDKKKAAEFSADLLSWQKTHTDINQYPIEIKIEEQ